MGLLWPNPFKRRLGKKKRFDLKEFARRMRKLEESDEEKSQEQPNEKPRNNEQKKSSGT